jgi:hypothetical protein
MQIKAAWLPGAILRSSALPSKLHLQCELEYAY